jgi:AAA15 family ATPase/GTPase
MLLPDLHVKNYRLFQDFKLERLARVNLVAGRNNVGKSALLEAALLASTQNPRDALTQVLSQRGEREGERGEWTLSPLFFNYQLTQDSTIEIKAGKRWFKMSVLDRDESEDIFPINVQYPEREKPLRLSSVKGVTEDLPHRVPLWKVESDRVYLIRGTDTLYSRYRELSMWWDKVALTPRRDTVINILQVIEPRLQAVDFLRQQDNVMVLLKGADAPVFMGSLGDGMQHLLVMAVTLANTQGGILLLDEVETGLHYSVLLDLWRLLFKTTRELDVQIIATTHSWDCIAAFSQVWSEVEQTEGQFCRLDRVGEQILTEFYPPDELAFAVKEGIETR